MKCDTIPPIYFNLKTFFKLKHLFLIFFLGVFLSACNKPNDFIEQPKPIFGKGLISLQVQGGQKVDCTQYATCVYDETSPKETLNNVTKGLLGNAFGYDQYQFHLRNTDFGITDPGSDFTLDFEVSSINARISFDPEFLGHLNEDKFHFGIDYWYIRYIPVYEPVIVGILDDGFPEDDPLIGSNKLYKNPGEIPGNGIDDDGNGYIDDVTGWNFYDNIPPFPRQPVYSHAHPIAIAADKLDQYNAAGINPDVKLMNLSYGLKLLDLPAEQTAIVPALRYAINKGAKIINISFGNGIN